MKKSWLFIFFICTLVLSPINTDAQQSEIKLTLDKIIEHAEHNSLYRQNVDWTRLKREMFELTKDQEVLKKACRWAEQSVALERNFYNTDTLANLYNVTGKKAKAKELAMESIRLGEANGEDVSMTKKLLEQL